MSELSELSCYSLWLSSCCPSSHRVLLDSFHLKHTRTHTCCCPWFSARPLLSRVWKYTVSDAVMWSLSVNRQNAVVNHCWPGFNVSFIRGVNIYIYGNTQQALPCVHLPLHRLRPSHVTAFHVPLCCGTVGATHTENTRPHFADYLTWSNYGSWSKLGRVQRESTVLSKGLNT